MLDIILEYGHSFIECVNNAWHICMTININPSLYSVDCLR